MHSQLIILDKLLAYTQQQSNIDNWDPTLKPYEVEAIKKWVYQDEASHMIIILKNTGRPGTLTEVFLLVSL